MPQQTFEKEPVTDDPDQKRADDLLKILHRWGIELSEIADNFNASEPDLASDKEIVTTAWRIAGGENPSKGLLTRAKSRTLTCDGKIEAAFRNYVSWLKYILTGTEFEKNVSVVDDRFPFPACLPCRGAFTSRLIL
jgi:hypothetical protein